MRKRNLLSTLVALSLATSSLLAKPAVADENGKMPGMFSVACGEYVYFSQGNLQYVGTWQFAEQQWEFFGNSQSNNHRDLLGWGTGNNPNLVTTNKSDYLTFNEWGNNVITNGGNKANSGWRTLTKTEWKYIIQESQLMKIVK